MRDMGSYPQTIKLADGTCHTVLKFDHILAIVQKNLGDEMYHLIRQKVEEVVKEKDDLEENYDSLSSDFDSMSEDFSSVCEIRDECDNADSAT